MPSLYIRLECSPTQFQQDHASYFETFQILQISGHSLSFNTHRYTIYPNHSSSSIQATNGNPIAQANPSATHESKLNESELAAPELVDAAAPAEEDEAAEEVEATCEVIDGEDECDSF